MKLKFYVLLVSIVTIILGYEYFVINLELKFLPSLFVLLKENVEYFKNMKITLETGKPISYVMGWLGFFIMCLTNIYIFRKRLGIFRNLGEIKGWLDFHIFCGLMGPILIIFHTNFKVGGLVAISFWSMIISFSSGIVGKYFYMQLLQGKSELENEVNEIKNNFISIRKKHSLNTTDVALSASLQNALNLAGAGALISGTNTGMLASLVSSFSGDMKMFFKSPAIPQGYPIYAKDTLKEYALSARRLLFFESFKNIMGYWHTFHLPFAIFMYLVAIIHIISALVFRVS